MPRLPDTHFLDLQAPIDRWDEALPLGNGLTGGLLWGARHELKLSLDRGDLWDTRRSAITQRPDWTCSTIRRLVRKRSQAQLVKRFDKPYDIPYPTKIPAGRLEFVFGQGNEVRAFRLDLHRAIGTAVLARSRLETFFSATAPVAMIRVTGGVPVLRLVAPPYWVSDRMNQHTLGTSTCGHGVTAAATDRTNRKTSGIPTPTDPLALAQLGYPPPRAGGHGSFSWFEQTGANGFRYAIVTGRRRRGRAVEWAVAITCTNDDPDPLALGRQRVAEALADGFDRRLKPHVRWWRAFWSRSYVRVPDLPVQKHYDLVNYFLGSASRSGAPPIPLQGVWTADTGKLPPWKGDYHHDLNTQLTYSHYLSANRLDEGRAFLDFMWKLRPTAQAFARRFYGAPGAAVPGVMAIDGAPMGGWGMYALSPTNGAWVGHLFYLHWLYTRDDRFLRARAYPYVADIGTCLAALLKPGRDRKLRLPLSSSPEIHDNSLAAWLTPNSNYDLALLRWLFGALDEMARAAGRPAAEERHWRSLFARLPKLSVMEDGLHPPAGAPGAMAGRPAGALKLSPDEALTESHRHHSHLMAIYPLGLLTMEQTRREQIILLNSLYQLDALGTGAWIGFSFTWAASLAARCGLAERARLMLDLFLRGFISRNGFHLNGDYRDLGLSRWKYRPFTLEANFAAAQAVQEMLLQSWGGTVRVFPAVPAEWTDGRFDHLRAEGAYLVSAVRRHGRTIRVAVTAERNGVLRLRNPFGLARARWNLSGVRRVGADYRVRLNSGQTLIGRRA
ncbi:MAG: glycoside hydrolase N-terminal domain-containing protein [Lentisphaerae bacterium]|nr:glycoside hydrolase N-terminal domain-containing protein [Lentisphaerota bacterium]